MRAAVIALALLAAVACGKYGPPARSVATKPAASPAVSAAPPAADTEECADPNAPAQGAGKSP